MLKHYWLVFKRKWLSYPIAYFSKYCLRMILWTCRYQIQGMEQFVRVASQQKCILMLWHNRLAIVAEVLNKHAPHFIYSAFISKSRDGEPLALLANSYKAGRAIRVSHSAKHQGLKMVIESLKTKEDIIVFTPDGPRGPRYKMKPGIVLAAKESNAAIIPFSWSAKSYWTLKTWDKFMLPKPFTTLTITFGSPIMIDPSVDVEQAVADLESAMQNCV